MKDSQDLMQVRLRAEVLKSELRREPLELSEFCVRKNCWRDLGPDFPALALAQLLIANKSSSSEHLMASVLSSY